MHAQKVNSHAVCVRARVRVCACARARAASITFWTYEQVRQIKYCLQNNFYV